MLAVGLAGAKSKDPKTTGNTAQLVITAHPGDGDMQARDVTVLEDRTPVSVARLERMTGDLGDMQLFVFLDDSTRTSSLGLQLPELKAFLQNLPAKTQVAVGYMRNGTFALAQPFTADHAKAAGNLRLPVSIPGENGSPYFALSDLVKRWPSKEPTDRRAVLMFTDGVDRYYGSSMLDDPYVDESMHDALKSGVTVYSVYLRGAGRYGQGLWGTDVGQSRLIQIGEETGGYAYFEGFTDPVTITPFLKDLTDRFANQYRLTVNAGGERGIHTVKVRTELPGVKIEAPTQMYVQ
jgi:hypothetical protein